MNAATTTLRRCRTFQRAPLGRVVRPGYWASGRRVPYDPAASSDPDSRWSQFERQVRRYLMLADPDVLIFTAAIVVANRLDADPVWAFLVAPPGGVKTELIRSLDRISDVYPLSTLTPQ